MTKERKEKLVELLGSAQYNLSKVKVVGTAIIPLISSQIETAIQEIDPDWKPIE